MADEPTLLVVGGRRPRAGVRSDRPMQFYMTAQEKTALQQMAHLERRKMAEIVRDAVNEYVADFGERQVFRRAGPFE
jgi:hypothetical protein